MENRIYTWTIPGIDNQKKLSLLLTKKVEWLSHSRAKLAIKNGLVTANGQKVTDIVSKGLTNEVIELDLRQGFSPRWRTAGLLRGVKIVHEDDDILVADKPPGILVHQTDDKERGTLLEIIHRYWRKRKRSPGYLKTVHRIDKETSGLVVFPLNATAHRSLAYQFVQHTVARSYLCIVHGHVQPEKGTLINYIVHKAKGRNRRGCSDREGVGKKAVTHYQVRRYLPGYSLVECRLETGISHQIRIQFMEAHYPLLGETVYIPKGLRRKQKFPRQALHASSLKLLHPRTKKYVTFMAELAQDMARYLMKNS